MCPGARLSRMAPGVAGREAKHQRCQPRGLPKPCSFGGQLLVGLLLEPSTSSFGNKKPLNGGVGVVLSRSSNAAQVCALGHFARWVLTLAEIGMALGFDMTRSSIRRFRRNHQVQSWNQRLASYRICAFGWEVVVAVASADVGAGALSFSEEAHTFFTTAGLCG